jgi:thymidylate kinase
MFSIALIGPDGAGKTTIGRRLEYTLPMPVKYLYMGVNSDSSNVMLPTTRLIHAVKRALGVKPDVAGPPDPNRVKPRPKGLVKQGVAGLRSGLRLVNRLSEEWFRQGLAWYYQRRGYIVLFDRHFFSDYYAYDIANNGPSRPFSRRIHGFMLEHVYPQPDLVIYLDAPAEVLLARKGEGTVEALERRRQDYLQLRDLVKHFVTVDATQPADKVVCDVAELIRDFYETQHRNGLKALHA